MRVLVTGGAGFIGSHLVDALVKKGHEVSVFDNLEPQVHQGKVPSYLNKDALFVEADVLNYNLFRSEVMNCDVVFHFAAMVGVGQSMYQPSRYCNVNVVGTANLLNVLANENHNVKKVIVASSMSTYGEGEYWCEMCGNVSVSLRSDEQMNRKEWEHLCPYCSRVVEPRRTGEGKLQEINSIYASTKKTQEEMVLNFGKSYGIPSVALRYFNVYGTRQSLNNPYTGVAAIFLSRVKNGNAPTVFEDGLQSRDFISVKDITQANMLVMKSKAADYKALNVGTGVPHTIKDVADTIIKLYKSDLKPEITGQFRKGDVRHCIADISAIERLGFEPKTSFESGMKDLIKWSENESSVDKVENATQELQNKGLLN